MGAIPLEYGRPRRRRAWRLLGLIVLLLVLSAALHGRVSASIDKAIARRGYLQLQQQAAESDFPKDQVAISLRLATSWCGNSYFLHDKIVDGCQNDEMGDRFMVSLPEIEKYLGTVTLPAPAGVPQYWRKHLLLHQRRRQDGSKRLVSLIGGFCPASSPNQPSNIRAYLVADTIEPATFLKSARAARQSRLDLPSVPRVMKGEAFYTLFAGHPDPSDEGCVSVVYQTPGGAGVAIGRLMPDDTIAWSLK